MIFDCHINSDRFQILHINTHLDHGSALARQEGAKLILNYLEQINPASLPVIITGDFNTPLPLIAASQEQAPNAYDIFLANGFKDTFAEAGYEESLDYHTVHNFQGHEFEGDEFMSQNAAHHPKVSWRLDWILTRDGVKKIRTRAWQVVEQTNPPIYPSDHYPVVAELVVE